MKEIGSGMRVRCSPCQCALCGAGACVVVAGRGAGVAGSTVCGLTMAMVDHWLSGLRLEIGMVMFTDEQPGGMEWT